ncbi:leucine-rich repeat domain-containing protein [Aeoliella sp. SH292]|uniref:leucine-rich repeat domain-containing protein n=1 Tax=Aeoliella sp. SH292 TaxID=3454464 RepID=UPI003F9673CB
MPANSTTRWLRSLFRFRLRTLLVVMLLVSVACGYLGKHLYRKSIERPIVARIEAAGGQVGYDYQWSPSLANHMSEADPPGPQVIRLLLGEDIFTSVETVWLSGANTNDDVKQVCNLPALRSIWLRGNQISDNCVPALVNAERLEGISFFCTSITPSGLRHFKDLPRLKHVSLAEGSASTNHVQAVAQLPHLETLQIFRSEANGRAIKSLGRVQRLERLELHECAMLDDSELTSLRALHGLRRLELSSTSATSEVLKVVSQLAGLEHLSIEGLPLSDEDVCQLSSLTKLQVLDMASTGLGDDGVVAIAGLHNLRHLDLGQTYVSDASASQLAKLRNLEYLDLEQTDMTDGSLERFGPLSKLKRLKLDIGTGRGFTLDGAQAFQQAHPDCEIECTEYFPDGTSARIDLTTGEIKTF